MTALIVGELCGLLSIDASPMDKALDRAMNAAEKRTDQTMRNLEKRGGQMTRNLTLPLAAVGVAATKMSVDFDTVFGRMVGLAGVAADEVDGLKAAVMDLSGETGRGPQELAEALYFVRSAGLAGQDALDALEMSAKGAAAGLGSTVAVADAVTSAMNGYGPSVLSAAEATDVLVATAREGKAEASDLAPQFGRLIPVASELGITFQDVGAGLAFLSRSSGDASLSATQLDGVMQKLIKPSQQGAEALEAVGLSTDSLRASIEERGLLGTLTMLRDRLDDSGFVRFFDDVQGLQGALALTRNEGELAIPVFDALGASAGSTESAFATWASTMGARNQKAFANLQQAMIELGDELAPLAAQVADWASALLGWFSELDDGSKMMVVTFGVAVASIGPLITVSVNLAKAVRSIGTAYQWATIQAGAFTTGGVAALSPTLIAAGAVAAALVAVGAAFRTYGQEADRAKDQASEWVKGFAGDFDPAKASMADLEAEIGKLTGAADEWQESADNALNPFKDKSSKQARDELRTLAEPLIEIRDEAKILQREMGITGDEALALAGDQAFMAEATDNATGEFEAEAAEVARARGELEQYAAQLAAMFDPLFGAQDALHRLNDAQRAVTDAVAANRDKNKDNNVSQEEMLRLNQAAVAAALEYEQSLITLTAAIANGDVSLQEAQGTLQRWVEQGRITQEQADQTAYSFGGLTAQAERVPDEIGIDVNAHGIESVIAAIRRLDAAARAAGENPLTVVASITARDHMIGQSTGGLVGAARGRPGPTDTVARLLDPREYVIDAATVSRLGVPNLEALLAGGGSLAPMSGGGVSSTTTIDRRRDIKIDLHYPEPEPGSTGTGRALRKASLYSGDD